MPAEKSHRSSLRKQARNKGVRSATRTAIAKARLTLEEDEGKGEKSKAAVLQAVKALDLAAKKGIIHPNNAARRKSRLMKRLSTAKA